jgi:rhodanese-related sulfurtransferase
LTKTTIALAAIFLFLACNGEPEVTDPSKQVSDIDIKVFKKELHADLVADGSLDGFVVVDARMPTEFAVRSIPGAICVSYAGDPIDPLTRRFLNPLTGKMDLEALTLPDGSPIPKGKRIVFYSGRSG